MIVRRKNGEVHAVDFREIAPAGVTTEKVLAEIAAGAEGYPSTTVPGTVAGMSFVLEKFGTKSLAELIAPAIVLAREHKLGARQATSLSWNWNKLKKDPLARAVCARQCAKPLVRVGVFLFKTLAESQFWANRGGFLHGLLGGGATPAAWGALLCWVFAPVALGARAFRQKDF
jgi:gamma-glutamyltranspeptidase